MVKAIIAGGRNCRLTPSDLDFLDYVHDIYDFEEIVSGGCRGVDLDAEAWARSEGIPIKCFIPLWLEHGRAADPIRTREMIYYVDIGDIVILFPPGDQRTDDIKKKAQNKGIAIIERIHHPIVDAGHCPF